MATTTKITAPQRKERCWIFLAIAAWNLLLTISFPIQANVLQYSEGFYSRTVWFSLVTEMIGLYPHPGYLLAWPFRQTVTAFSPPTWDCSGMGGLSLLLIMICSSFLAVALFYGRRWAGYIAAFTGFLVAGFQYQESHIHTVYKQNYVTNSSLRTIQETLDSAMRIGDFEKLIGSIVSALLALTLLRVLLAKKITGKADRFEEASVGFKNDAVTKRGRQFLFGALIFSALMLLVLAGDTPTRLNTYYGSESGFSSLFELLLLIPVVIAAIGVSRTNDRFFVGLSVGYASLFPVLLVVTWFLYLWNPNSPPREVKGPVWTAVIICVWILAAALLVLFRTRRRPPPEHGKFSLGLIVALAFCVAALDACHMHFIHVGLLRN